MLDPPRLEALAAVAHHGSFSAAARALHLTQPAVSRQVAMLEHALGTRLLHRDRGAVRPTEAGALLLGHARAALDRLALAEAQVRALAAPPSGRVRLGSFSSALVHLSSEAGALLAEEHPEVVIVDDLVDPPTALAKLGRGELDLAVVFDAPFAPVGVPDGVRVEALFDDPVRVLLPAGHPRAGAGVVDPADLGSDTWLRPQDGTAAALVDHVLARTGLEPALLPAGRGDEPVETQALVAAGRAVALTYELTVLVSGHALAVVPLAGPALARRVAVARAEGPLPPAVAAVLDALRTVGRARRG